MQSTLSLLRSHLDILWNSANSGKKTRGKLERHKAVAAVLNSLSKKSTCLALTAASSLEMLCGPREEPSDAPDPLGWAELSVIILETLSLACHEASESKSVSKTGIATIRSDYMACFKSVLKLSMQHGQPGVIKHIVRSFLSYAYHWLSKPSLRAILADQIWQCVRDLLQDGANRAMLTPVIIRTWIDVCFEQLTGRGPLQHTSHVVSNIASDVLQIFATPIESYDILTQSTRGISSSKMLGGDFSYAIICHRCCMMLIVAESMPRRDARELQATAFRTLTIALLDHALDVLGSSALNSIIHLCLKPIISCWTIRRYHDSAVSLAKVLMLLAPNHKKMSDSFRHRILADMKDESASAVIRAGHNVKRDFIDTAASCFSFRETLEFAGAPEIRHGLVIVWLRVSFSIISRQVLKRETSILVDSSDVFDQCRKSAETITDIFKGYRKLRDNSYEEIVRWSALIIEVTSSLANKIHLRGNNRCSNARSSWQALYLELREHASKGKGSVRSRTIGYNVTGEDIQSDQLLVRVLSHLCSLDIIDSSTLDYAFKNSSTSKLSIPYPLDRITGMGIALPSAHEVTYFRNLLGRSGICNEDGDHLRFQLVHSLIDVIQDQSFLGTSLLKILLDGSVAVLGLARGECSLCPSRCFEDSSHIIERPRSLTALHCFQSFFGLSLSNFQLTGNGAHLVQRVLNQHWVWEGQENFESRTLFFSKGMVELNTLRCESTSNVFFTTTMSRHFSVKSSITAAIEKQVVLKMKRFLKDIIPCDLNSDATNNENSSNQGLFACSNVTGFCNSIQANKGLRALIFVGNYLLHGLRLGLISPGKAPNTLEQNVCEEIATLFESLIKCLAASKVEVLLEKYQLTNEVIKTGSQIFSILDTDAERHEHRSGNVWHSLSKEILRSIKSILIMVGEHLVSNLIQRTKQSVRKVQRFSNNDLFDPHSYEGANRSQKRKNDFATQDAGREKRRRASSVSGSGDSFYSYDVQSLEQGSEDIPECDDDQQCSDSEESDDFAGDASKVSPSEKIAQHQHESKKYTALSTKITIVLSTCIGELPFIGEELLDICVRGLDDVDDVERMLSPDGFERAALITNIIDPLFLDWRKSVWDILFSIGTGPALLAVAKDVLKFGTLWKGREEVIQSFMCFYVEHPDSGKKRNYPLSPKMETSRVLFLDYARLFFERYLVIVLSRNGTQDRTPDCNILSLVSGLVSISEYFRLRHALRMPRTTRISYLRFGLSVIELITLGFGNTYYSLEEEGGPSSTLSEAVHSIQTALCKSLCDSEALVRIVASNIVSRLLTVYESHPMEQAEKIIRDHLPPVSVCNDNKSFFGSGISYLAEGEVDEGINQAHWGLSEEEKEALYALHESFRHVGSQAKGYAAIVTLGGVASLREDLVPSCLLQLIDRVAENCHFLSAAYHVIVKVCAALEYKSPSCLYSTFARLILPKWFLRAAGVERLNKFPASLLVDENHHRDGIVFDWMRDQQSSLLPHLLVQEKEMSLGITTKFADILGVDIGTMLSDNIGAFSRIFPMQFTGGLHERGKLLWQAIDDKLNGKSMPLMYREKTNVIQALLQSTSANCRCLKALRGRKFDREKCLGFSRDTHDLKPPLYDPLVISLAINQLYASDANLLIVPKSVLKGSLFAEVRDEQTGEIVADRFTGFLKECQKSNTTLLFVLLTIYQSLIGPPSPQASQNRLDAYFCVGMLWRMLDVSIFAKDANVRLSFFRLIARGFEHLETAFDAAWLLVDVQRKVAELYNTCPHILVEEDDLMVSAARPVFLSCMKSSRERQMYELLSAISPILVSVIVNSYKPNKKVLRQTASTSLKEILKLCSDQGLWTVILSNGPFPQEKQFKEVRMNYEKSKDIVENSSSVSNLHSVLSSLSRFQGIYRLRNNFQPSVSILACLQELCSLLTESTVSDLSLRIRRETWIRSSGLERITVPLLGDSISCLVDLIYRAPTRLMNGFSKCKLTTISDKSELALAGNSSRGDIERLILHEVGNVLSILGLVHPTSAPFIPIETHHRSIPARSENDNYEDADSGIRLSLYLLHDLLQSRSPTIARCALATLMAILSSNDGKRIYSREKVMLKALGCFRSNDRKLGTNIASKSNVMFQEPLSGETIVFSSFPALKATKLWHITMETSFSTTCYEEWMRRLCSVLASNCTSGALRALISACFMSYKLSCEMLPYLLMDILSDSNEEDLSEISALLRDHVLNNENTPIPILRTFVHALDVLCQIGLKVLYSKGVTAWLRKPGTKNALQCYYALQVPYIEAAKAALKSGAYFSVIRFSQLHIDQKVTDVEISRAVKKSSGTKAERRYSSCPAREQALEDSERIGKEEVKELLKEALTQISEPDGVRGFGSSVNVATSVASIASLDQDWSTSLAALEVVGRTNSVHGFFGPSETLEQFEALENQPAHRLDLQGELDTFRSFIGLGTLNIAIDYWEGLRNRISKGDVKDAYQRSRTTSSAVERLNDLRYAAAWKLGHWESPAMLSGRDTFVSKTAFSMHNFHNAVYDVLRFFETDRFAEVPGILLSSRMMVLLGLRSESSGVSAQSIFQAASQLRVFNILERTKPLLSLPGRGLPGTSLLSQRLERDASQYGNSEHSQMALHSNSNMEIVHAVNSRTSTKSLNSKDFLREMFTGSGFFGVDDGDFQDGLVLSRHAFHESILAEDLPVILMRCLHRKKDVARVSATVSAQVLSNGGAGAWARAASCLGTPEISSLAEANSTDRIAWKMQEARLRWSANHDARSRKHALSIVKDIIAQDLGGRALSRRPDSKSGRCQEGLTWDKSGDDQNEVAFLRSEACCMAAKWALDMRTHEPMDLFQMYLESGLEAIPESQSTGRLAGRAHFAMATFADAQISNINTYRKSRKFDEMVSSVRDMEVAVEKLKTMKDERNLKAKSKRITSRRTSRSARSQLTSGAVTENQIGRDLDHLILAEQRKARLDRGRLEKLNRTYQKWQGLACKHFSACLRHGGSYDLRAAFRMVAIWLDSAEMRDQISISLTEGGSSRVTPSTQDGVNVPVSKLLPLAPQLASRLNYAENTACPGFQTVLTSTITEMAGLFPAHCLWQLLALSNATRDSANHERYSSLYRGNKDKKEAADKILERLQALHGDSVREMKKVADAYILLSEVNESRKSGKHLDMREYDLLKLGELTHVPIPTAPLPLNGTDYCEKLPHICGFERKASVCAGLSKPLRLVCIGSDGKNYPQIVKGRDDLRGDAVMEQMFAILNNLLQKDGNAARRSLHIRTYRIIPLSPFSGIMQFVSNTKQLKELLVDREEQTVSHPARSSLHERYRPKDMKHNQIMGKVYELRQPQNALRRVQVLSTLWQRIQPVFRYFFIEQWPDPGEWFSHQTSYARSVAVMSMVGFILGLGDRHLSNVLLDIHTGEVVHIDFGIAFEQGKLLPTPEHMPFRLTRDIVDGFGIAGVEGVFRQCSEITLKVMRRNKDVLRTVIEVLLHDPMFNWALTPEEVLKEQGSGQVSDGEFFESDDLSRSPRDSAVAAVTRKVKQNIEGSREALRALNRISEKLDGLEGTERLSVEAHVARLVDEAQAFHVIAPVFPGWCPWL